MYEPVSAVNASSAPADQQVAQVLATGPGSVAAAALAGVDTRRLSDAGRLDLLRAWQAQASWAEAQGARVLVDLVGRSRVEPTDGDDDPVVQQRSRLYEAALTLRMSEQATRARWEVARDLATRLPATRDALDRGRISWTHARAVSEATVVVDDATAGLVDATVADRAGDQTPSRLRQRCRAVVDRLDAQAAQRRLARAHRDRRVERFTTPDGHTGLEVWSTPRDICLIWTALTDLAGPRETDDPRTLGARRVDALLSLCLGTGNAAGHRRDEAAGPPVRPHAATRPRTPVEVQVVVDLATLLGMADHPAELPGYGPIPAATARDWITDPTSWRRLVTDPVTGHLLDYGPLRRLAPTRLRAYLAARDQTCTFPDCRQPARRADADHHPPFNPDGTGGSTSATDMASLCRQHHRWKTHHGWQPHRQPDGGTRWTSPTGKTYLSDRPPVLRQ